MQETTSRPSYSMKTFFIQNGRLKHFGTNLKFTCQRKFFYHPIFKFFLHFRNNILLKLRSKTLKGKWNYKKFKNFSWYNLVPIVFFKIFGLRKHRFYVTRCFPPLNIGSRYLIKGIQSLKSIGYLLLMFIDGKKGIICKIPIYKLSSIAR